MEDKESINRGRKMKTKFSPIATCQLIWNKSKAHQSPRLVVKYTTGYNEEKWYLCCFFLLLFRILKKKKKKRDKEEEESKKAVYFPQDFSKKKVKKTTSSPVSKQGAYTIYIAAGHADVKVRLLSVDVETWCVTAVRCVGTRCHAK